jgi:AcrR family transcriptional regulator
MRKVNPARIAAAQTPDPTPSGQGMPRQPRPRREATRRRLLDAAVRVFAERGFDAASLDQVAARAGFTKGAVYSNFTSKDELFFALMDDQIRRRVDAVRALVPQGSAADPVDSLHRIGHLLTEAFTDQRDWQLLFLDFWRRAVCDSSVRPQFLQHRRALRTAISQAIREVLPAGAAFGDHNGNDLVTVVLALSNGLAIERLTDPDVVNNDLFGRILAALQAQAPREQRDGSDHAAG